MQKRLELIVPVHGHYDHALDAGVLALWSEAKIVADKSIKAVIDASGRLDPAPLGITEWRKPRSTSPFDPAEPRRNVVHDENGFKVTAIRSEHGANPFVWLTKGHTSDRLSFPAGIAELKIGTSFSVLIEYQNRKILIIPSAGAVTDEFSNPKIDADVVFLSVGGLGARSRTEIENYWNNTVGEVSPSIVYLIHWDSDRHEFDFNNPEFKVARPPLLSRVVKIFEEIRSDEVDVRFPPALQRFDPFQ